MLLTNNKRIKLTWSRVKRIDRWVDTQRCDVTRQYNGCVKWENVVAGSRSVSSTRVYRLNRRDRTSLEVEGDVLEEHPSLASKCGLLPPQMAYDLAMQILPYHSKRVTVDVIYEERYVDLRHGTFSHLKSKQHVNDLPARSSDRIQEYCRWFGSPSSHGKVVTSTNSPTPANTGE
jgi:hypothetical protein